jgi:methylmalonyl-CoA mutase N-terminal domain/subunit
MNDRNDGRDKWAKEFAQQTSADDVRLNRSGIEIKPLYTPDDWSGAGFDAKLGYPGQLPLTRGIYPSMHRGRTWSQNQIIGLATPGEYNKRLRVMMDAGVTTISTASCNSFYRGFDADEVDIELLGTCGTIINTIDDMATCFDGVPFHTVPLSFSDPTPFTMLAFTVALARRRGIPLSTLRGTSNQSDYISHYVANHMFYRLALPGAQRLLIDHIAYSNEHMPGWNPVSVVGQHMQQAGATPAEAMGFTISSALQFANDCIARGMNPESFLPRFTFFFDVSISFFEEIARFRAGRRLWAKLVRERLGTDDPRCTRFKFHAQTSGADLTRQQPLNNIARVTIQAISGIMGGLQSLHADGFDEVLSTPTEESARIAVATQNILREEAGLTDVIDPMGGSYYVEALTDQMEAAIMKVIEKVDAAGGMFAAVESGLVQGMIGESAIAFQERIDDGDLTLVGVNAYQVEEDASVWPSQALPERGLIEEQLQRLKTFKAERSANAVRKALDNLAAAANDPTQNMFAMIVEAADANVTHGEICSCLRQELGYGHPLIAA